MEIRRKSLNLLGDSITEGAGASSPEKCFAERLNQSGCFSIVRNYGIGGTRIAPNRIPSVEPKWDQDFYTRCTEMEDAELIAVFGGTNDFGHGDAPFGELTDTFAETFCGACRGMLEKLIAGYPKAQIFVITPLHRTAENDPRGEGQKEPGKTLKEYVNAIVSMAEEYHLPVLDFFNRPPFPADAQYLADGLHPNDRGHERLAAEIISFLEREQMLS